MPPEPERESTSLALPQHLAGESTAAAKRIVLQITAGCAGGWVAGPGRGQPCNVAAATTAAAAAAASDGKQVSSGNACSVQRAKHCRT